MVTDPGPSFGLDFAVGFWLLVGGPSCGHPLVSSLSCVCDLCLATKRSSPSERTVRRSRTPGRCGGAGRPPDAGGPPGFFGTAFAQAFVCISDSISGACDFGGFSRCVGKAEQCEQFSLRSSSLECHWAGDSAQFAWSGSARRGCLRSAETMDTQLSWQRCRAFS